MSNPYAPPEDRPREAPPADGSAPGPGSGPTPPPTGPWGGGPTPPPTGPWGAPAGPDRSPAGVPYERRPAAPAGPPPGPADVLRVAVLLRWTALLVLVAVIGDLFVFPWFLAAGVVGVVALVVGTRAMTLAARTRQRAPRTVLALLVVVALLGLTRPATALLTWDAESSYARCQASAITVQAQNACLTEYRQALDARLTTLKTP